MTGPSADLRSAPQVLDGYAEDGLLEELGIASDPVYLFPVAGGADFEQAVFITRPDRQVARERAVWFRGSGVLYFPDIASLIESEIDPTGPAEAGGLLSFPFSE